MERSGAGRDLSGYVAVVTGGNGGIGLGLAHGLVAAGAGVAIWGRNEEKNAKALAELRASGGDAEAYVCDVEDQAAVNDTFAASFDRFGRVDAMFANAGINRLAPFVEMELEQFRAVLRNHLESTFLCFQVAARHFLERGEGGCLVGVSSIAASLGQARGAPYSAAKAGIESLVRSVAVELGPSGIRCNTIVPGFILTPIWGEEAEETHAELIEATSRRTPARRWGTPEDFGAVAAFLADPRLTFHTGDTIVVDGGFIIT
ncbi:MAG TPA: SDR family NAD(P)-dependent oxidoreductase [Nitriliruptorales bacterium]